MAQEGLERKEKKEETDQKWDPKRIPAASSRLSSGKQAGRRDFTCIPEGKYWVSDTAFLRYFKLLSVVDNLKKAVCCPE